VQRDNLIGGDGAKSIAAALERNSSLQYLGLVRCSLGFLFQLKLRFVVSVIASILFLLLLPLMIFCLFRLVFLFRFDSLRVSQSGNNISVAVACHLVACILHNPNLTELVLDHQPFACVGLDAWLNEGLPVVSLLRPAEVGWTVVLESLREVSMQNVF
jgi:hypothetical protein